MRGLDGKVALVTGGTGGIGSAICERLARHGCTVATTYRNEAKAREWRDAHLAAGRDFAIYPCDVGSFADCAQLAESLTRDLGRVDIVINNAGITRDITFRKMTPEQWAQVINADLDSVFNVTKQFIEGMLERGFGRVVNISSINGQKGMFGQTNYAAAKAGMHGFAMSLAQESAKKGVTVNTVSPGYIATDMVMAVPEEIRARIIAQIPVGRLGNPEDIAAMVAFLASDDAAFITGANIPVNGGQFMS
ncbi:MAG: acetoacetyl-CoA reductase [Thiotrichales bacterium]